MQQAIQRAAAGNRYTLTPGGSLNPFSPLYSGRAVPYYHSLLPARPFNSTLEGIRVHSGMGGVSGGMSGLYGLYGFGTVDPKIDQYIKAGGSIAGGVVSAVAAPAVAHLLGIAVATAVPIVGAAFAGVLMGVELILHSGCGETCVITSQWANQAEPYLRDNIQTYFRITDRPRTDFDKYSALNIFDAVWAGLVQRCSQPGLGTPGQNCIADRQSGACKWRQRADGVGMSNPVIPGEPQPGECWNWFSGYRDPIANDHTVPLPDPATTGGGTGTGSGSGSGTGAGAGAGGAGTDPLGDALGPKAPLMLAGLLVALAVMS